MGKTKLSYAELVLIATDRGLNVEKLKTFTKIEAATGRKVYLQNPSSIENDSCSRIDISGFKVELDGVKNVEKPWGNVRQQVKFDGEPDDVMKTFEAVLDSMKTLGPAPKRVVKRGEHQPAENKGPKSRRDLIVETAAKLVSKGYDHLNAIKIARDEVDEQLTAPAVVVPMLQPELEQEQVACADEEKES